MAERKENRNAIRSRRMIRQALMELIQEKDYDKITVCDIVRRADLNRSTFYAHYPDIRGVVEEIQNEMFRKDVELLKEMDFLELLQNPKPLLTSLSSVLGENIGFLSKLGHTEDLHIRLDGFRRIMVENICNNNAIPQELRESADFSIRIYFFIGGIMNTYQQWAEGTLSCSLEEITDVIARMVTKTAEDILPVDHE